MSADSVTISGEYGSATIRGLTEDQLEDYLVEQVELHVNSPAYETDDIRIMPDTHPAPACVVGFTAPIRGKVVPNTVGGDIGCGMDAVNLGQLDLSSEDLEAIDDEIRSQVPMGFSVHDDGAFHIVDDFPWEHTTLKLDWFELQSGIDVTRGFGGYGEDYLKDLYQRVGADSTRVINSVGTLGGGNHFIELSRDQETGDVWSVIHSGSRGIGQNIASYHQDRATEYRTNEFVQENLPEEHKEYIVPDLDDPELTSWLLGGKGKSYIDSEAIREDYSGTNIGQVHDEIRAGHPKNRDGTPELDYLEGDEVAEYIQDMMFAQVYATVSRNQMQIRVRDAIQTILDEPVNEVDHIESVHNYIDPADAVLRKGACPAREGDRIVIPLNMSDGVLLCEAKGNDEWNNSAPHGAGRISSRSDAFDNNSMDEFEHAMEGIVSSSVTESTLDEAPSSYKPAELIENAIEPTASVETKLTPILNIKALD